MLTGYRRCFCIYSVHHRGTAARPGLVLGLDRGGVCHGMAFRVEAHHADATLAYLQAREQVNGVYREEHVAVRLKDGRTILAIAYIAERAHPSFAGPLAVSHQAHIIRAARGLSGPNVEYLANTLTHLAAIGIRERELERVSTLCGPVFVRSAGSSRVGPRALSLVRASQGFRIHARLMRPADRRRFAHRQRVKGG